MQELVDAINGTNALNVAGALCVHASIDETGKLVIENVAGGDLTVGVTNDAGGTRADEHPRPVRSAKPTGDGGRDPHRHRQRDPEVPGGAVRGPRCADRSAHQGFGLQRLNLNGDNLKVIFNENNTTSINIEGVIFDSQGLGLSPLIDGGSADTANNWQLQSDFEISQSLKKLDDALNLVRSQASNFGSNLIVLQTRQDFKQAIATPQRRPDPHPGGHERGRREPPRPADASSSTQALRSAQTDQAVLRLFG